MQKSKGKEWREGGKQETYLLVRFSLDCLLHYFEFKLLIYVINKIVQIHIKAYMKFLYENTEKHTVVDKCQRLLLFFSCD